MNYFRVWINIIISLLVLMVAWRPDSPVTSSVLGLASGLLFINGLAWLEKLK